MASSSVNLLFTFLSFNTGGQ